MLKNNVQNLQQKVRYWTPAFNTDEWETAANAAIHQRQSAKEAKQGGEADEEETEMGLSNPVRETKTTRSGRKGTCFKVVESVPSKKGNMKLNEATPRKKKSNRTKNGEG